MTNQTEQSTDQLKSQIEQELINSGKYQQFFQNLQIQLINSGWQENFQNLVSEHLLKQQQQGSGNDELKSMKVLGELTGKGLAMVPDDVKVGLLKDLKGFLDDIVVDE
ncbi:unnamed protein product [Ambrosiozyma monospora]|uniref:Unnamed protein product n=1 Tax=Ambrosiozyma monospora TaxID=43982 RepID=A0A9W6YZT8_AMBMO|nr:unnamed protein product [Ambrosiozyma monospora]